MPPCAPVTDFDRDDFPKKPKINNNWLPFKPGTQLVLEGRANRGGGILPHRVTFTVTDLTKVIDGVRSRVIWDVDENEGVLSETELAFFAQDKDGNVWNVGEYPEEYAPTGEFLGAPSTWIHGLAGAQAGVHMQANPTVGTPPYLQGFVPEIDFLDCAQVVHAGQSTCVPVACYNDILITYETSPLDRDGAVQTKSHAPGVGIVQVGELNDPEGETLVLTEHRRLGWRGLRRARRAALKLDRRGRRVSDVYAQTPPAKRYAPWRWR